MTSPAGYGNAGSIMEEELRTHLNFPASDQLEESQPAFSRYHIAAVYITAHEAEWGLKPGMPYEAISADCQE